MVAFAANDDTEGNVTLVHPPWTCDACGEPIDSIADGWVEWIVVEHGETRRSRDLRLVHRHIKSPLLPGGHCQFNQQTEFERDRGTVGDLPLDRLLGPDGLVELLALRERGLPWDALQRMILRLHLPGYEIGRHHIDEAIAAGAIIPKLPAGLYHHEDLVAAIEWARKRERTH